MDPSAANQNDLEKIDWYEHLDLQEPLRDVRLDLINDNLTEDLPEASTQNASIEINKDKDLIDINDFQDLDPLEDLSEWDLWEDEDFPFAGLNDFCKSSDQAGGSSSATTADPDGPKVEKRSGPLTLEEIEKHFEMPIIVAARELGVGITQLKKKCREFNISRWPNRKLRSMQSLIQNAKELGLNKEVEALIEYKKAMEKTPGLDLSEKTKRLRQACFKAMYRRRGPPNP